MLMNVNLQIGLFIVVLLILAKPLGLYMALAADGRAPLLSRIGGPFEKLIYRVAGIDPAVEMSWKTYALALLLSAWNNARTPDKLKAGVNLRNSVLHALMRRD